MDLYSMRADAYDLGYEEKHKLLAYVLTVRPITFLVGTHKYVCP